MSRHFADVNTTYDAWLERTRILAEDVEFCCFAENYHVGADEAKDLAEALWCRCVEASVLIADELPGTVPYTKLLGYVGLITSDDADFDMPDAERTHGRRLNTELAIELGMLPPTGNGR